MAVEVRMETLECWQPDPSGRHEFRYFSKGRSTSWVSDDLQLSHDGRPWLRETPSSPEITETQGNARWPQVPPEADSSVQRGRRPGWYRNASNPEHVRYWDGSQWAEHRSEPSGTSRPAPVVPVGAPSTPVSSEQSTEPEGWFSDPLGRYRFRWLSAGQATRLVSDDAGQVSFDEPIENVERGPSRADREPIGAPEDFSAAPAEWYPDPANPARL